MNARVRASSETGLSLIELLIAILVLGIGVTSIVLALGTAINTSRTTRNQASGETVVRTVTEELKETSLELTYSSASCPDLEALVADVADDPAVAGWAITTDGAPEYWLPLTGSWADRDTCNSEYRDDLCAFEGPPASFTTCDDARTVGGWQRVPVAITVDTDDPSDSAAIDHNTVVYLRRSVEAP